MSRLRWALNLFERPALRVPTVFCMPPMTSPLCEGEIPPNQNVAIEHVFGTGDEKIIEEPDK